MKRYLTTVLGLAAAAMVFGLTTTARAQVWVEAGDAGQTISTAQGINFPAGTPVTTILGTIGSPGDADIYQIDITTASTFSATTVNAVTGASNLDTELYLFNSAGKAVYANDDDPGGLSLQSTLPAGNLNGPLAAGVYYLAISTSGNEPVNFANTLLFTADSPSTTIRTPAPSVPGGESNFDSTFADPGTGAYEIDLTSVAAVPEPGTWLAAALSLGAIVFLRRRNLKRATGVVVLLLAALMAGPAFAVSPTYTGVPQNLGNGLDALVDSHNQIQSGKVSRETLTSFNGYATEKASNYSHLAITDTDSGKIVIDIHLTGAFSVSKMQKLLVERAPSLEVTAVDANYRQAGVIEGFVDIADVAAIANIGGVSSVQLVPKPIHRKKVGGGPAILPAGTTPDILVGSYFDQAVTQHRVDMISSIYNPTNVASGGDGTGMSVGCISDSFNELPNAPTAATNVANFDLPGSGSNPYNTTAVLDLSDSPGGTDEGRALCQDVYKVAPRAALAFATADNGEVSFANAMRGLAGIPGFTFPGQGTFAANCVCDDVGYSDEAFFEDGVESQGVDDTSAAGACYFSSAANDVDVNGYYSPLRVVAWNGSVTAPNPTGGVNSNINLTGVPSSLYAGGFHNFDPSGNPANQNIAQTVNIAANNNTSTTLQWDDPYDFNAGLQSIGPQIYMNTGTITGATLVSFNGSSSPPLPTLTAGQGYVITEHATSGNYDAQVFILDPTGTQIYSQDTGIDETVTFTAPTTGQYTFQFGRFATTTGNFEFTVNTATITPYVVSNWNLLAFRVDNGAYVPASSLTFNTIATNQPLQLGFTNRTSSTIAAIQYVFARGNTPAAGQRAATVIRYLIPGNGLAGYGPAEYFTYGSPTTGGHPTAATANGAAAYSVFRPNLPESFTSPGPATIFFDRNNNLIPNGPVIRLQPTIAACDGANSAWAEVGDSNSDGDSTGNFSGTSSAAPHSAAIAALVMQAHGGPGHVSPAQMTSILTSTTFPHNLTPYTSSASIKTSNGGKVTISIISDNSSNSGAISGNVATTVGTGTNDPNAITVGYAGPGFVKSIAFNPNGLAAQGGGYSDGNNGVGPTPTPTPPQETVTYFSNIYPGMVFLPTTKAFTVGNLSIGLGAGDVTPAFTNQAPAPSTAGQWWTMTLTFPNNNFSGGKSLRFTVGRGVQHSSTVGTFAAPTGGSPLGGPSSGTTASQPIGDLWGGGVIIPENTSTTTGMTVTVTMSDNSTATGTINSRVGVGYSNLDGYGLINAQAAVNAPCPGGGPLPPNPCQ